MHLGVLRKRHPPPGAPPGTLVIRPDGQRPDIRVIAYAADAVHEREHVLPPELTTSVAERVSWIDVRGLAEEGLLRAIAERLAIHPLALEDVVNVPQRPKSELYDAHQLVILRMALVENDQIRLEQVALLIGSTYAASFQERDGDVFDPVRKRIRQGRGPIRGQGAGYLGYALIDTIVDGFYPVLEHIGDQLEKLEEEVVDRPTRSTLRRIYAAKRQLLDLRRAIWPHRELVAALVRDESPFISAEARFYLRDTANHAAQLLDVLEAYRDMVAGLIDVYLSSQSNRTNEVMRVLTVIASIFIPLTFLAGVYGMNFQAMPELHSRLGYPVVVGVMIAIAVALLWKFRQLGWIGSGRDEEE
jgi:magnesium transporter